MVEFQNQSQNLSKFKPQSIKIMDQVREVLRYHHYARRTEEAYVKWILAFIRFNGTRDPKTLGKQEIEAFLSDMATNKNYAAATQNLAFNSIIFLYKQVLDLPIIEEFEPVRSKRPVRLPVVLSKKEVGKLLMAMTGIRSLMAKLMYGGGLRVMEVLRLRIQDIDFGNGYLMVRDAKGGKDRTTLLAPSITEELKQHLLGVRQLFEHDLEQGEANVYVPHNLAKKNPKAGATWEWQYVFPSQKLSNDPRSGEIRRHHLDESGLQKGIRAAKIKVGIDKRVTSHTLRHSFATHLLEAGTNIRVVQELLGHADVKMTEIYTHLLEQNVSTVVSPLENLSLN